MSYKNSVLSGAPDFISFLPEFQAITKSKLYEARERVANLDREVLIDKFRSAFNDGKRLAAFMLSEDLNYRGIPPAFRLSHMSSSEYNINQKFDLLVYDLRWLRREHSEHVKKVRYARYRDLFSQNEVYFSKAAEYVFYQGKRPAWKIVASLSMTETQQFDCMWLRSSPISKRHKAAQAMRDDVFNALMENLQTVRRSKSFTDVDAKVTLIRRHALWICSQMSAKSPSEVAARYMQLTGQNITRHVAARQLQKIDEVLRKQQLLKNKKSD
jgi:hypothetical protein